LNTVTLNPAQVPPQVAAPAALEAVHTQANFFDVREIEGSGGHRH
jgi:hypothetical protein